MTRLDPSAGSRNVAPSLYQIFWGSLASGCRRVAKWRRQGWLGKDALERRRRSLRFEALEPRLLLSADLSYTAAAAGDLTLRAEDVGGVATLELVDSNDSGIVFASELLSNINGSSGYGARIDAADFDITLRIDASAEAAGIAGGIVFVGGAGASALVAPDLVNTWTLSGSKSGGVGSVSFSGVEQLIGGGDADTLVGTAQDTVWNVTGADAGDVEGMLFADIENLLGAADNEDTFIVGALGGLSGLMDGGAGGFDSLVLDGGLLAYGSVRCPPLGDRDLGAHGDPRAQLENDLFLRMADVEAVVDVIDALFTDFCRLRASDSWRRQVLPALRGWASGLA